MATTTKKATDEVVETAYDPEELVPYRANISKEDQKDIFVCVNGENCQIQRGKTVQIKRKFYEVLMNSEEMDQLAFDRQKELEQS